MSKPFISSIMPVRPEWIDYNGHLNMAYYHVLLDNGVDELWRDFGFGPDYIKASGCTTYSAEFHIYYRREVHEGDRLRASFQIIDHNDKSIHFAQQLTHEDGWVSAEGEGIVLHIDQSGPRVAPFPSDKLAQIAALYEQHKSLPRPEFVGKTMGIKRK
ncbi:thioesterase family protein [Lentibacter algarum]|uniref:thioesterase family protein n=1 Tax=Lentibacter algarum TaxID=576131 RepID=UPI001C08192E|nr:thioesterase family protein [Lentibacter algarum]MBU2982844.1 thioesterase family protein [Lentibacter algarum]